MSTTMTRWDPLQQIAQIQRDLDRAFGGLLPDGGQARRPWLPAVDVEQTQNEIILRLDLPGMNRDDVSIDVRDRTLIVSGERREEREENHEGFFTRERVVGKFTRSFMLPEGVDPGSVQAQFQDGVLEIRIPRPTQEQPRHIEIQQSNGQQQSKQSQQSPAGQQQ
jgi:HSP20 family protein